MPKYIVLWRRSVDWGWDYRNRLFTDLDKACTFAWKKGGRVFGLNPEFGYEVKINTKEGGTWND